MTPYVIRQGDYLTKLAARRGFDADEVWNDPKNESLRSKRKNGNMLLPGDVLHIPDDPPEGLDISSGGTHRYKVVVPTVKVELVMKHLDDPMANEAYEVEGLGAPGEKVEGSTDGEGKLSLDVPTRLREVRVVFPKRGIAVPVLVGDLDPPEDMSGVRQRLEHLGYYGWYGTQGEGGEGSLDQDERDAEAIGAFQAAVGLAVTRTLDATTLKKILEKHGS